MSELSINKNSSHGGVDGNSTQFFQPKEKDNATEYLSERAKKLTTVVYIITNLIPQTDPLRLFIRRSSIKLLSFMRMSPAGNSPEEVSIEAVNLCKKIVEMLEIAFFSGYVSEMNYSVLKTEFDLFTNEILNYTGFQQAVDRNSLKVKSAPDKMSFSESAILKGQKSGYPVLKSRAEGRAEGIGIVPSKSIVEAKKVSRKEAIISIIKLKGAVSIRDISSVVVNCSEKTVQRELMSLVVGGVLKRAGERRWSVYSLAE
ncbi:MAG: hypothetical protein AAB635_01035 [Patescibacteria group bacterium]